MARKRDYKEGENPSFNRDFFLLFLLMVPIGLVLIGAIVVVSQYRTFLALVETQPWAELSDSAMTSRVSNGFNDSLWQRVKTFSNSPKAGLDTLVLNEEELVELIGHVPPEKLGSIRIHALLRDTLLVLLTSEPISGLKGKLSGLFRKAAKNSGYLNGRIEGFPSLVNGRLELGLVRAFLAQGKIPNGTLLKRGIIQPRGLVDDPKTFDLFVGSLKKAYVRDSQLILVRESK